ncbi:hypothetical protein ABH930_005283 [Kitasatospora sp. GAS204A]|uniref:SUKH-4 family immunity protein n=1 Tax=unclassified Kitasatospora TaxID=2633591 RepID=UPI00247522A3|nr:SUKH-4 family immunity protein [Kitasatospora sp. GAS204B]MDH6117860.1 hypothetical protein [Kitasatospora sp. GAS204B]
MQLKVDIDRERLADWFGEDAIHRLPEQALPAVLTHAPTRRLLTEVGLPRGGGGFLRFDTDPDLLLQPLATRLDGPSVGASHLLVLGAVQRDWLVLDGVSGQVALAGTSYDQPAQVVLDVLAGDLSVVLLFLHELAGLRAGAADPAAHGGRRGPAVVAEVTGALAQRMRAVDPAVFEPSGMAPYWSAAVLASGLRWAARPGDLLAYEITPELVAELGEVRPVRAPDLPAALSHEPTRRLLTTVGLPTTDHLWGDQVLPLATLRESDPWYAEPDAEIERAHQLDHLWLGDTAYDCQVVLDGQRGHLEVTVGDGDEDWPAARLHADLSAYYLTLWVLTRLRAEALRWTTLHTPADWQVFTPVDLFQEAALQLIAEIDPSAVQDETSFWNALADDGHMGGLLGG